MTRTTPSFIETAGVFYAANTLGWAAFFMIFEIFIESPMLLGYAAMTWPTLFSFDAVSLAIAMVSAILTDLYVHLRYWPGTVKQRNGPPAG